MSNLINDVKFALRRLRKSSGFTFTTILILALGIGGVTAMFNTLYMVMIRPLPYVEPDRLVLGRATYSGTINPMVSVQDYFDYREQSRSFSSLDAYFFGPIEITVTTNEGAQREDMLPVSPGLFPTLGVNMFLGRSFTVPEADANGFSEVIVSYTYWRNYLGGQADAIGESLVINGNPSTLIGVIPPDFHFIQDVDLWVPMFPKAQNREPRRYNNWMVLGRLKDGVSLAEAQSDVDVIAAQLEQTYPDTNTNKALLLTPLQNAFTEQYCSILSMLCAGAGAILLIACANAAGLLLARGATRRGELAVCAAMGASRYRLMRPLLSEALLLAGTAGVAGTILSVWIQDMLLRLMPIETLLLGTVELSVPVLIFVLVITLLTGLGFGILPAWRAQRINLIQDLHASGRRMVQQGLRLRSALVIGQVTLTFLLLLVAGLLVRSFTWLHHSDPGFDTKNLLTVEVPLPGQAYKNPQRIAFFTSLLEELRSLPNVERAAAISQIPIRNPSNDVEIYAEGASPTNSADRRSGDQRIVLPGYFETMGIPLLAGRDIRATDTADNARVVVISQHLAEDLFPDRDPLEQKVVIDRDKEVLWKVVGVVGDAKVHSLYQDTIRRGTFYRSYGQLIPETMRLVVRTTGDPLAIVAPLRSMIKKMDLQVPLSGPRTMEQIMANSTISYKATTLYLTIFSVLALALAVIGIYGLLTYLVTQSQRDIGIRMALGAEPSNVLKIVLRNGMKLVGLGLCIGVVVALAVTRILSSMLFGIKPTDALTFGLVVMLLGIGSSLACAIPACRAAKIDPMEALRYE